VFATPDHRTAPVAQLWPDSILPIRDSAPGWYQTDGGYVERQQIQPLGETWTGSAPKTVTAPHFWAEVIAPVAPIYAHCALDAPMIHRIGHGGVMRVTDWLPGQPDWYGISTADGQHIGWSQVARWREINLLLRPSAGLELTLDQHNRLLRASVGGQSLLQAAYASPEAVPPGQYELSRSLPGSTGASDSGHYGAAWNLLLGDGNTLSGVYWHNRFGTAAPGPAIQLPPMLARWLYEHLPEPALLSVHS
jgi:hypothetical protein